MEKNMKNFLFKATGLLMAILMIGVGLLSCSEEKGHVTEDPETTDIESAEATSNDSGAAIQVAVYIDEVLTETLLTSEEQGYRISAPTKPNDITTDPQSEQYFYGWFLDRSCQVPLTDETQFQENGEIYGKLISVNPSDFTYSVSNGVASVTGVNHLTGSFVVIPRLYNSYPVVSIADNAFQKQSGIKALVLCEGITSIGAYAFQGCQSMEQVTFPDSLRDIGDFAFHSCSSLTEVTVPKSVKGMGWGVFQSCTSLKEITLPFLGQGTFDPQCVNLAAIFGVRAANIVISGKPWNYSNGGIPESLETVTVTGGKKIGKCAFTSCKSLKQINLPDGLITIESEAFTNCTGLTEIHIPKSVTSIGSIAFMECSSLTSITIPDKVAKIGDQAFSGCSALEKVSIPSSVKEIGVRMFQKCVNLSEVEIPVEVKCIKEQAFYGCVKLSVIHFNGTKAQWNAIEIDANSKWDLDTGNYTIHCTDGTINKK
ncbi:MAG: leucine-rich repeat domain-containing protein [Eubacteriales bacterium]